MLIYNHNNGKRCDVQVDKIKIKEIMDKKNIQTQTQLASMMGI